MGNCGPQRRSGESRVEPSAAEALPLLPLSLSPASSHVGASLFRYQDRIVRIDRIRTQLLGSLPSAPHRDTQLLTGGKRSPPSVDYGFYNLMIPPSDGGEKNNSRCTDRTDWYFATLQCSSGERPYSNNATEGRAPVISVDIKIQNIYIYIYIHFFLEFSESPWQS